MGKNPHEIDQEKTFKKSSTFKDKKQVKLTKEKKRISFTLDDKEGLEPGDLKRLQRELQKLDGDDVSEKTIKQPWSDN